MPKSASYKYFVRYSARFKKDYKQIKKQGKDVDELKQIITKLAYGEELPVQYRDHALIGNYYGHRECHINPDWLLIYRIDDAELTLTATRTGSHSDLLS